MKMADYFGNNPADRQTDRQTDRHTNKSDFGSGNKRTHQPVRGRRNTALNLPARTQLCHSYDSCWQDCVWTLDIHTGTDLRYATSTANINKRFSYRWQNAQQHVHLIIEMHIVCMC